VRVEFEGNRLFTSERLRGLTYECYGEDEQEFDPEKLDYCLRAHVLTFLRRSGYLRAQLGEPRAERAWAGETVTVPVDEKELYRLGRVTLEGAAHFPAERLREMLPLKAGDVADSVALDRWLNEHLKRLYADEGFIQYGYDIEPEFHLNTDTGEGVADFSVVIDEGRRFRLRRLTFASGADVPEEALRAALGLREGAVFRACDYADGIKNLNDHGLFGPGGRFELIDRDKDVEFLPDEETAELDVRIRLTEIGGERPARGAPGKPSLVRRPQTREE
jgi:outer membrane protein assembly factor BamA